MLVLVSAELLSLPTASKQPCPQGWTIKQAKTGGTLGKLLCLWAGVGLTILMSESVKPVCDPCHGTERPRRRVGV